MSDSDKMPLKTFWEAVEKRLAACSPTELCAILRAMAAETPPDGRQAFLSKLERIDETHDALQQTLGQEDLLIDIDDLAQELKTTMAADWDEWNEYDDEDSLGPYETFVSPLVGLFDRTEAAFDYGDPSLAREAYQRLFGIVDLEDGYGRGVRLSDLVGVDPAEACARYLRAVYETEARERRPQALLEQMRRARSWLISAYPMLEDLIQISRQPLPDRELFLEDWIAFLRTQSGNEADAWLREAVRFSQGTPGLETLARNEGQTRPRAYLDWFTALEQEDRHAEVLVTAQEALRVLPAGLPIRAAIADHLCAAAARLDDQETLHAGRWEAFLARPTLTRLLDLRDTAPAGSAQIALMGRAVQHMQNVRAQSSTRPGAIEWGTDNLESAVQVNKSTLAHACLFAHEFERARQIGDAEQALGWSSSDNPQGLVAAFFMVLLSGQAPDALSPNLALVWQERLDSSLYLWYGPAQESVRLRLERAYMELFAAASVGDRRGMLSWCLDVALRRVDAIVSGQHRRSYDKAATLAAACAETLRSCGDKETASILVQDVRDRFPRHRAFQAELQAALHRR